MTTQVVVIAHGNGIAAFQRHEKFWLAYKAPLLVVCPENDAIASRHETLATGAAQRNGAESVARLGKMLDALAARSWDQVVIHEYDSLSLEPRLPDRPGLHGILFANQESPKFMAPRYANPPWTMDRMSFDLIHAKARQYPGLIEEGEADRWLSALAMLAGVPIYDYQPPGFSRGTITSDDVPQLMAAVKGRQCIHFHGVKQDWVLRAIEQFYDEANPKGPR